MVTGVARYPFGRSIGLFFTAAIVGITGAFVAVVVMVVIAHYSGLSRNLDADIDNPGSIVSSVSAIAAYVTMAWFVLARYPRITHQSGYEIGFRALRRWDIGVIIGAIILLIVLRFVYVALVLAPTHQLHHTQSGFEHFHTTSIGETFLATATLVVVGPFAEELLFRAVLFGSLARKMPVIVAALISSILFAALHGDWVFGPLLAALGLITAIVYYRTQNIVAAMLVHAANNTLPALFLIAHGTK